MSVGALRAEAAAADELATRITSEARVLGPLLDPVAARRGPDVWRGPAADDFATALQRWRGRLDEAAEELLAVARRLRFRADGLRADATRLELAEREAARERAERLAERHRVNVP